MECSFCGAKLNIKGKIMRKDTCPECGRDLRCCKQCKFYDNHAYNECKEVMAERIVDKERANFCEYFVMKGASRGKGKAAEARAALEALFSR